MVVTKSCKLKLPRIEHKKGDPYREPPFCLLTDQVSAEQKSMTPSADRSYLNPATGKPVSRSTSNVAAAIIENFLASRFAGRPSNAMRCPTYFGASSASFVGASGSSSLEGRNASSGGLDRSTPRLTLWTFFNSCRISQICLNH